MGGKGGTDGEWGQDWLAGTAPGGGGGGGEETGQDDGQSGGDGARGQVWVGI